MPWLHGSDMWYIIGIYLMFNGLWILHARVQNLFFVV